MFSLNCFELFYLFFNLVSTIFYIRLSTSLRQVCSLVSCLIWPHDAWTVTRFIPAVVMLCATTISWLDIVVTSKCLSHRIIACVVATCSTCTSSAGKAVWAFRAHLDTAWTHIKLSKFGSKTFTSMPRSFPTDSLAWIHPTLERSMFMLVLTLVLRSSSNF